MVSAGVCATSALLVGLDVLIFATQRTSQLAVVEREIDAAEVVVRVQSLLLQPAELAQRGTTSDVAVTIQAPDGTIYGQVRSEGSVVRREVELASGMRAIFTVSRRSVDQALWRLATLAGLVTLLVIALAALILRWISDVALAPLAQVVEAARRTASGSRGERLLPDQPHTELGEMAHAYDQMLDALEASEQAAGRLASIVESSEEAIVGIASDGTVFSWNLAAERILGYEASERVGTPVRDIFPVRGQQEMTDALAAMSSGEPVRRRETAGRCADGGEVELAVTLSPVRDASGLVTGASMIARDVTLEHRMAEALQTTLGNLEVALDQARVSEARTRRFLDDAAHQLRTPVAGIQACAETLLRVTRPADRDRLLSALVKETSRAGRLITSLLTLARLDRYQISLSAEPCDVERLCRDEAARIAALASGLELVVRAESPGALALADRNAVREVLGNLLDNARRHAATKVEMTVRAGPSRVEVQVRNDGPPIPNDRVAAVFERFVSLDGAGGTGLGLAIARDLARACRGGLTYEEEAFVLRLPTGGGSATAKHPDRQLPPSQDGQ